jgi:hypothetical protein
MPVNKLSLKPLAMCLVLLPLTILMTGPVFGQFALVPAASTWKYLDNGTDQGSAWRQPAFDDSAWLAGPAQLGYGDRDETTVVGYGPNRNRKYVTTYFRHSFDVPDPSRYRGLKLRLLRDDGALVYINGVEIVRSDMPSGKVNYLTLALSNVTGSDEDTFYEFFVDPQRLVVGTNVLAVEIHQSSATSSDISFDLELITAGAMRKAPYLLFAGDNTNMKVLWQLNSTAACTISWGLDMLYSLGNEQTLEFGIDHQHAYTITNLTPSTKYYYKVTADTNTFVGSFRAAPPSYANHTDLIVYGDTRSYPADHDQVAEAIVSTCAADSSFQSVIVSVGDLVNDGDQESDWDTELFNAAYSHLQEMLASMPYEVAIGNHERSGKLFSKYFPYPFVVGRYWSFDYGPAHFVMVDQYTNYGPSSPQLNWIKNDLASTVKPWKFICLHEPGWSAGGHTNSIRVQSCLQPLCEEYGVAILFAGHNHYYARAEVNGVQHITTGGGGAPLSPPDTTYPNIVTGTKTLHYCKIEIDDSLLRFTAVTPAGNVIDKFTLNRTLVGHKPVR